MLYKVTPMMPSAGSEKESAPREPRKRRKSAVFDADGHEVLISLTCLKCKKLKPLVQFGLRKMADGAIRNQPWCRTCRGAAGAKKDPPLTPEALIAQVPSIAAAMEAHRDEEPT